MKKMLIIPMIFIMLVMIVTSVNASTSLAEEIYDMGNSYGVTEYHKRQMERYFTNNPATDEQREQVLEKTRECIKLMDQMKASDVTKLNVKQLEEIEKIIKEACEVLGLSISFDNTNPNGPGFFVTKNGKTIGEYEFRASDFVGSTQQSSTNAQLSNGQTASAQTTGQTTGQTASTQTTGQTASAQTTNNKQSSSKSTTSSKKFVYTGANSTFAFTSMAMVVVALTVLVKLRRNA